jgi:hypothetical protein
MQELATKSFNRKTRAGCAKFAKTNFQPAFWLCSGKLWTHKEFSGGESTTHRTEGKLFRALPTAFTARLFIEEREAQYGVPAAAL